MVTCKKRNFSLANHKQEIIETLIVEKEIPQAQFPFLVCSFSFQQMQIKTHLACSYPSSLNRFCTEFQFLGHKVSKISRSIFSLFCSANKRVLP